MGRLKRGSLCLILTILALSSVSSAETVVRATRTILPPVIDGKLIEASWQEAIPIRDFRIMDTDNPARAKTIARILYDDHNIYLGFKCLEPDMDSLITRVHKEHDAPLWREDSVEIMLDTTLDRTDYFHFIVNASGSKFDRTVTQGGHVGDAGWDGEWKAKSFLGKDYWSVEVAIPFHTLGITPEVGSTWGLNLCRNKKNPFEQSSIAKLGAFNLAGRFARLEGLDVDFKRYTYAVGRVSISTEIKEEKLQVMVGVPIKNLTGKRREIKIESWLICPQGTPYLRSAILELEPGEEKEGQIGPFVLEARGEYDSYFIISDPQTRKTLHFSREKLEVSFVPMAIELIEPFYREAIFASQNLEKVILEVKVKLPAGELKDKRLLVGIREPDKSELLVEKVIKSPSRVNRVEFPNHRLPYGELLIVAALKDKNDELVADTKHRLQKLPHRKGEVWLGRDLNWYVDGERFFFCAAWGWGPEKNRYQEYVSVNWAPPVVEGQKKIEMLALLTNHVRTGRKSPAEVKELIRARVREVRDNPDLFAYHLADEPTQGQGISVEAMEMFYHIVREEDPYRPVILTHNSVTDGFDYVHAADLISFHRYPAYIINERVSNMSSIMAFADHFGRLGEKYGKSISFLVQGFNYGDHGLVNQRIPSYYETRAAVFMAVVGGARGFIQYNRMADHYPELVIGSPHIIRERNYLSRAIMSPDSQLPVQVSSEKIRTRLKEVEGELYLFAVNVSLEPREVKVTIPGLENYLENCHRLQVISGDRKVKVAGDFFTDHFDAFEVHIYRTSLEETGLTPVKEIIRKIDKANEARRRPGNLAFQM